MASRSPRCSETIFTRAEPRCACGARFERAPDVLGRGDAEAEQGGRGLGPLEVADDALCGRARGVGRCPVMPTREADRCIRS